MGSGPRTTARIDTNNSFISFLRSLPPTFWLSVSTLVLALAVSVAFFIYFRRRSSASSAPRFGLPRRPSSLRRKIKRAMNGPSSSSSSSGRPRSGSAREVDPRLVAVLDGSAPEPDVDNDADAAAATDDADLLELQQGAKRVRNDGGATLCVECEDQPATVYCDACLDPYCSLCFRAQHKKGKRRTHTWRKAVDLRSEDMEVLVGEQALFSLSTLPPVAVAVAAAPAAADNDMDDDSSPLPDDADWTAAAAAATGALSEDMLERAKYVPLRLSLDERKQLRLMEAALRVSEYTDKIDILSYQSKTKRIHAQIRELCAILCGLTVAADYQRGQELIRDRTFAENEPFFQCLFEVARRHKILNPEKMRSEYGKMMYILMDSVSPDVSDLLRFSVVSPLQTVYTTLEAAGGLDMLRDPLIHVATRDVSVPPGTPRAVVRQLVQQKERAVAALSAKYASATLSRDALCRCLYSLGDNSSYLSFNRDPVDRMLEYLQRFFKSDSYEEGLSLAISSGRGGARLSHSHRTQFHFVLQSLSLWREILHHMFQLWYLAESDMLSSDNGYALRDTGQGLNRLQHSPRVSRLMHTILHRTQQKLGEWVGSSVIHLGDHNVPNALMFIDKYTQISRILNPIVITLQFIEHVAPKDAHLAKFLKDAFGGGEMAAKHILADFFRHAFDGSGADNFFDAGSCIDGRLTSAWNWCSTLDRKPFAPVFKLAGFNGFDGDFQQ